MTNHDFNRPYRRSVRLRGYDYSRAGAYFVTICTEDRACLFGDAVTDGDMRLNDSGRMVMAEWDALPTRFSTVELDAFVIMPNHIHGVIVIAATSPTDRATDHRATTRVAPTRANAPRPIRRGGPCACPGHSPLHGGTMRPRTVDLALPDSIKYALITSRGPRAPL